MAAASLIPLKTYLIAGHVAFAACVFLGSVALMSPFMGASYLSPSAEHHRQLLIPEWFSLVLQGREDVLVWLIALAYPVCVVGALVLWRVRERQAQRYVRERRGL